MPPLGTIESDRSRMNPYAQGGENSTSVNSKNDGPSNPYAQSAQASPVAQLSSSLQGASASAALGHICNGNCHHAHQEGRDAKAEPKQAQSSQQELKQNVSGASRTLVNPYAQGGENSRSVNSKNDGPSNPYAQSAQANPVAQSSSSLQGASASAALGHICNGSCHHGSQKAGGSGALFSENTSGWTRSSFGFQQGFAGTQVRDSNTSSTQVFPRALQVSTSDSQPSGQIVSGKYSAAMGEASSAKSLAFGQGSITTFFSAQRGGGGKGELGNLPQMLSKSSPSTASAGQQSGQVVLGKSLAATGEGAGGRSLAFVQGLVATLASAQPGAGLKGQIGNLSQGFSKYTPMLGMDQRLAFIGQGRGFAMLGDAAIGKSGAVNRIFASMMLPTQAPSGAKGQLFHVAQGLFKYSQVIAGIQHSAQIAQAKEWGAILIRPDSTREVSAHSSVSILSSDRTGTKLRQTQQVSQLLDPHLDLSQVQLEIAQIEGEIAQIMQMWMALGVQSYRQSMAYRAMDRSFIDSAFAAVFAGMFSVKQKKQDLRRSLKQLLKRKRVLLGQVDGEEDGGQEELLDEDSFELRWFEQNEAYL